MFVKLSEKYTQKRAFQYINLPLVQQRKSTAKSREGAEETSTNLSRLNLAKAVNRFPEPSLPTRLLLSTLFGAGYCEHRLHEKGAGGGI
jgi:hypothetical protein